MAKKKEETPVLCYVVPDSALGWDDAAVKDNVLLHIQGSVFYSISAPYIFFYIKPSQVARLANIDGVRNSGIATKALSKLV